jgi:outer membrane receptor for ferrienterochelin and colicins
MLRHRVWWFAVSSVVLTPIAAAEDGTPAIPIRDLPPFPDVEADTTDVSEIGVYGAALAEEETVVGASKREQSLGTVASAVTVVTHDQLRRFGYRTLAEALRSVAGIYVVDDRQVERIGVRGVQLLGDANTRILILIDGTPLNEPWSAFVDGSTALPVSLDDVARIEVIRGPVSSIYGANAFFGIINIVTIESDQAPRGYGRTTMDTFGTFGGNAAFNQGSIDRQVRGSVSYQYRVGETVTFPDIAAQDPRAATTAADGARAVFGSLSLNFDRLFFQARAYDRIRELPGAPYESRLGSSGNVNHDQHLLGEVGYTRDATDKVTVAGRLYANRYRFENELELDRGDLMAFATEATSVWYGGEVRALADLMQARGRSLLSVTSGVSVERTATESSATTKPTPIETDLTILGVYAEASTEPTAWLAATVGARFDRNSEFTNLDNDPDDELGRVSPRVAVFLRRGDDYGAKFLYAEGFRNPSVFEAYYDDDLRFSPAVTVTGNPPPRPPTVKTQLRPETITAYEVVVYGRPATGVKVRLSAWEWRLRDLLQRGLVFDFMDDAQRFRYQNEARLVSRGAELETTYRDVVGRAAYLNAALAFTGRNCIARGGDGFGNLSLDPAEGNCDRRVNAPVFVGKVGASSQLLMRTFHVSAELAYVSARGTQDVPGARTTTVPGHAGLNLVWFAPHVRGFDVTIGARNLLGRERVPAQSDYNRINDPLTIADDVTVMEVPGAGPEVFARMGYRF